MVEPRVLQLAGVTPMPIREGNPQDRYIADTLASYYAQEKGKEHLSAEEYVELVLGNHLRIKRFIVGRHGSDGRIDVQGKDVDYGGLFFKSNPLRVTLGQTHPMAYKINGKVATSKPAMTLDEFFRNPHELRDMFLGVQESRRIVRGGAPVVPVDAFILAVSNTESVEKAMKNDASKAQRNRMRQVPMRLITHPLEIAKLNLLMHNPKNLRQIPLSRLQELAEQDESLVGFEGSNVKAEPIELDDIFRYATLPNEKMKGPDGRYVILATGSHGEEPVYFSPHALMFMSYVAAATRLNTDLTAAAKLGPYSVLGELVFHDPVQRLKAMMGEVSSWSLHG